MSKGWILIALMLLCTIGYAQEKSLVQKGNKLYEQKKFQEATAAYQQALQANPAYTPGTFNLGNALIQQKKYDAARKVMTAAVKNSKTGVEKSGANYNIGNTYMAESKWQEAVDAYKQALRKNPYDGDAKYNLSYALSKLKQQQGGGKDKNKDKKDDKNKKDDKKDQDKKKDDQKDKDKQDKQDQNQDQKDKEDKDQQHPQPQPSKLSEKQAENLLNALQQDEKKLQDKAQKAKGVPVKLEKDW